MKINKKLAAGVAGITMAGVAFAAGPAFAQTDDGSDDGTGDAVEDGTRSGPFADGLQELVDNGTISQAQLDSIVEQFQARLADGEGRFGGPRGVRGANSEVVTSLLGIEEDELREALADGQTLAEIAVANGVGVDTLVDELVAEKEARLDEKVADGTITAEEADEKRAELEERVTARVNGERPEGAPDGFGGPGRFGPRDADPAEVTTDA